jgi:hypothetical protein
MLVLELVLEPILLPKKLPAAIMTAKMYPYLDRKAAAATKVAPPSLVPLEVLWAQRLYRIADLLHSLKPGTLFPVLLPLQQSQFPPLGAFRFVKCTIFPRRV